tara:strand:- start:2662 stop:3924 length:1263 start_codon:yes stop_codon:yes gene_type:complete
MSFATGFVTGLAKSVDDQLKNDMLRTQKRMDGMEQYRVTRRRAEEDRVKKDRREVNEVFKNLASLVDGDMFKAKQLFEAGGGTVSGATSFYKDLKESQANLGKNFDINKAVTLSSELRPEGVTDADFINNYVRGVTKFKQGSMEGSGLLKLFGGDFGKQVDRRVDQSAPIETEDKFGLIKTAPAKINHEEFMKFKKYEKDNRIEVGTTLVSDLLILENEYSYETDDTKKKALQAKIVKRRNDITAAALAKRKATGTSSSFSKSSRDSILKSAYELRLGDKFITKGANEQIIISFKGNEAEGFDKKLQIIEQVRNEWKGVADTTFNTQLDNERTGVKQNISEYKQDFINGNEAVIGQRKYHTEFTTKAEVEKATQRNGTNPPKINKGDVVTYTIPEVRDSAGGITTPSKTVTGIWTGYKFI